VLTEIDGKLFGRGSTDDKVKATELQAVKLQQSKMKCLETPSSPYMAYCIT